jgi:hypothetical protein
MKYFKYIFGSICVGYFPTIIFISVLMPTSGGFMPWFWWLNLLGVWLISFPYYAAFVQTGLFVSRWFTKQEVKKYKKILSLIGIVFAFCSVVAATSVLMLESTLAPLALWSAIILVAFWIAEAIVKAVKKEKLSRSEGFYWKAFVATALIVSVVACLGAFAVFKINERIENAQREEYLESHPFAVWHNTPTIVCKRGDRGEIVVHLKSNRQYEYSGSYSDFRPHAKLVCKESKYVIEFDEMPSTDDYGAFTIYAGEVRDTTFYFTVPEDAPLGSYYIEMSFGDIKNTQEGILIVEK